jgi:kynureninase
MTLEQAQQEDQNDLLKHTRDLFHIPQHNGKDVLYFCGNSLGLQPKSVETALKHELEHWKNAGVEGHFTGEMPWMHYHKFLQPQTAQLVGAAEHEVIVMNTLTVNIHLLLFSFYNPTPTRFKIIMEAGAFPSDQYALETHVKQRGFQPDEAIIEVAPRAGEHTLRTEDICDIIKANGDSVALVFFSGVQYYTGQLFDIQTITNASKSVGALAGFDLAHAAGNVPLQLHAWDVDFAMWCTYKYLNSGPGGPSGVYIHERHALNKETYRLAGWWGHEESTRFKMQKGYLPMEGAAGWQMSNVPILSCAAHKASLDIFHSIGMEALRAKSIRLSAALLNIVDHLDVSMQLSVITPRETTARGCQVSILTGKDGRKLFDYLSQNGVISDWREPNVIRLAAVPLYNTFEDIYRLGILLKNFENQK